MSKTFVLAAFGGVGLILFDEEGNRLWEYPVLPGERLYGLDIDPVTNNIYLGVGFTKIIELTRLGNKVWEFFHPRLQDIHSIKAIGEGTLLVTSAINNAVLKISKKQGLISEWNFSDYFKSPEDPKDWTHLNYVEQTSDGGLLITSLYSPDKEGSEALRTNSNGDIVWRWDRDILRSAHCLTNFRDGHYLLGESLGQRIREVDQSGKVYTEFKDFRPYGVPHEIEVVDNKHVVVAVNAIGKEAEPPYILFIDWFSKPRKVKEINVEGATELYSIKCLREWSANPTEDEQNEIEKRLKALGYIT